MPDDVPDVPDGPDGPDVRDVPDIRDVLALGRGADGDPDACSTPVHELVAALARTAPDRPAVHSQGVTLTYAGLHSRAGEIAARIAAAGVRLGDRVALVTGPSTDMVAAVLGVLRAGAAYVPVDPAYPDRRLAEVLADARVAAIVTADAAAHRFDASGRPVLRLGEIDAVDAIDAVGAIDAVDDIKNIAVIAALGDGSGPDPVHVGPESAAYLIYTSGSTGRPKGVLVEHGHLAASTWARRAVYPDAPMFLLVSPLVFDSSVAGLWGALTTGGCLVVPTPDEVRDPERLARMVAEHGVTQLLCIPALYGVLLDAAERLGTHVLDSLDTVVVAGETLSDTLVARHFAVLGENVALVNEYGPTEATVWASYRRFDRPAPVSIGGPIPGARLYVLDETMDPVPRGVDGELYIGGSGVSRGYFERPEETARAFVRDPFAGREGARMYRTGDLARWNHDGELEFRGRRDHQVKIHGHRIELGAVEALLRSAPGVKEAVVVPDTARTRLVGFVVAAPETDAAELRESVARAAPAAMVPKWVVVLEALPVTIGGKIDRDSLAARADEPRPAGAGPGDPARRPAADGAMVSRVAAAWAEVLGRDDIPADVNFFDLGGHSITMFRLQDALERHTGSRPSVVLLFSHTTVAKQAELILESGQRPGEASAGTREDAARRARLLRAQRRRVDGEAAR